MLLVTHDADRLWQLVGTADADSGSGRTGHLHHTVDEDPTLIDMLDLTPGRSAWRSRPGGPWTGRVDGVRNRS